MKKVTFLFIFLFLFGGLKTFAQGSTIADGGIKLVDLLRNNDIQNQIASDIEGSPYLNEEWQEAVIETKDKQKIEVFARYRYYDNTMEIRKKDDVNIYGLSPNYTHSITIGDKYFVALNYTDKNEINKTIFFESLTDGQLSLLIQYDKTLTKAVNNGYRDTPAEMMAKRNFFVYNQDKKEMTALTKQSKKAILPLFGKYSTKVENYAKKNKLSFKKTDGLVKIFEYYNSIVSVKSESK